MQNILDGVYQNLSYESYDTIDAIRASELKLLIEDPRKLYFSNFEKQYDKEFQEKYGESVEKDSTALTFGNLWHEAVLEPEKFNKRIPCKASTTKGKSLPEDQRITPANKKKIDFMLMTLASTKIIHKIISNSEKEITIVCNGKKARFDFIRTAKEDGETVLYIGDLKTHSVPYKMNDNDNGYYERKLSFEVADYNYLAQLTYYKMILKELIEKYKTGGIKDIGVLKVIADQNITKIKMLIVFSGKDSPYVHNYLKIDNHIEEADIITKEGLLKQSLKIYNAQKQKHNGFSEMWDCPSREEIMSFEDVCALSWISDEVFNQLS